ncbi:hypothetical protein HK405_007182 [Cladochytrium tenue]|nr:hypothetical protein HK405_007182 [Cladochytrium tenue]
MHAALAVICVAAILILDVARRKEKPDREKRATGKRKSTDGYDLADAAPDGLAARLEVEEKRLAFETARLELDRKNHYATAKILMQLQENSAKILRQKKMDGSDNSDDGSILFSNGTGRSSSGSLSGSDPASLLNGSQTRSDIETDVSKAEAGLKKVEDEIVEAKSGMVEAKAAANVG